MTCEALEGQSGDGMEWDSDAAKKVQAAVATDANAPTDAHKAQIDGSGASGGYELGTGRLAAENADEIKGLKEILSHLEENGDTRASTRVQITAIRGEIAALTTTEATSQVDTDRWGDGSQGAGTPGGVEGWGLHTPSGTLVLVTLFQNEGGAWSNALAEPMFENLYHKAKPLSENVDRIKSLGWIMHPVLIVPVRAYQLRPKSAPVVTGEAPPCASELENKIGESDDASRV